MGKVSGTLYENRMVGLKVQDKNVSGLHEHINITMSFSMGINVRTTAYYSDHILTFVHHILSRKHRIM